MSSIAEGFLRESVEGRIVAASTGTVDRTHLGLPFLADGTLKIAPGGTPTDHRNGWPVDANGLLCTTTSTVGAATLDGFLRAPNGALVVTTTKTDFAAGYPRGANYELALTAVL